MEKIRSSKQSTKEAHIKLRRLGQHAYGLNRSIPYGVLELREVATCPHPNTEAISNE